MLKSEPKLNMLDYEQKITIRMNQSGPQGPKGPKGDTGPKGDIGPIGPKGDKGEGLTPEDLEKLNKTLVDIIKIEQEIIAIQADETTCKEDVKNLQEDLAAIKVNGTNYGILSGQDFYQLVNESATKFLVYDFVITTSAYTQGEWSIKANTFYEFRGSTELPQTNPLSWLTYDLGNTAKFQELSNLITTNTNTITTQQTQIANQETRITTLESKVSNSYPIMIGRVTKNGYLLLLDFTFVDNRGRFTSSDLDKIYMLSYGSSSYIDGTTGKIKCSFSTNNATTKCTGSCIADFCNSNISVTPYKFLILCKRKVDGSFEQISYPFYCTV